MHFFNKLVFAAIATGATVSLSLPASAEPKCEPGLPGCEVPPTQSVPEPSLMLGSLVLGGGLISKKLAKQREQAK